VVAKLLHICEPGRGYFGEKDAQQLAVIRRMVRDLDLPTEVVACPTVRAPDGLALSSRNARLSPEERAEAPVIFRALSAARTLIENGERDASRLKSEIRSVLADASRTTIDYIEIVDAASLAPVDVLAGPCLIAVAAWFGDTRLIDNVTVAV
jgi:pantoate--beta-alanine ligase